MGSYQQDRGVVRSPMCRDALILHQVTPTPLANRPKAMPQRTKARKADGGKCSSPLVDHMAKDARTERRDYTYTANERAAVTQPRVHAVDTV